MSKSPSSSLSGHGAFRSRPVHRLLVDAHDGRHQLAAELLELLTAVLHLTQISST